MAELLRRFVARQSGEWEAKMDSLASYMARVQRLREEQRASMHAINNTTRELLIAQRGEHEAEREKNESAFGAIIWLGCIRPRRRGLIA